MKNILLLAHDDEGQLARLHAALDLTRALDGHLHCIDVTPPPVYGGNSYAGLGDAIMLSDEREAEARNKARLCERLQHEGVAWSWQDATGDIADCILDAAMLADLIVLNPAFESSAAPDMRVVADHVLMKARRPVVAVPARAEGFHATGRGLVAWDGSVAVAETLRACVPLLRLAADVEIVMVDEGRGERDAQEAAAYLARHDIGCTVNVIKKQHKAPEYIIAAEARHWYADYVLMGAYGHGRLREAFGGVTRHMLSATKLPLVLGH